MGAEVASAYVTLIPSAKGMGKGIASELGGAGKSGGAAASKGFKGSFLSGVKSLAGPVAGLIGISAGVSFLKDANAEAREAQKVGALTTSTIKATGGAAKVTAKHVGDLAGAISAKTGIDDETIQSGQNMLLTFKNIRNEAGKGNKIFDQSSKALVDMSAAMGTDPKQAAIGLGKALNDPIKGVTALSRVGVTFTDQQKEQIKTLVDSGKTADAQKVILKELSSEFGGAAEAQATAGEKASVAFGNLKEQIGTALLPVIDKFASIASTKVIPAISGFISGMSDGTGAGGKFADIVGRVVDFLGDAWSFIQDKVIPVLRDLSEKVLAGARAAFENIGDAIRENRPFLDKLWAGLKKVGEVLTKYVIPFLGDVVEVALPALGGAIGDAIGVIKTIVDAFLRMAEFGVRAFRWVLEAAFNTFDGILSAAEKGLGWIPGLGDKIRGARQAFDDFGRKTVDKLDAVADKIKGVRDEINGIPKSKTFTLNMVTVTSTQDKNALGEYGGPRASGGPVSSRKFYLVGENGPELFAPRTSGSIIPNGGPTAVGGYDAQGQVFRGVLSIDRDGVAYVDGVARSAVNDGQAATAVRTRRSSLDGVRL